MTDYDVIVVGAGPAGTAAAYDLAINGVSVLLLDKASFPRIKACAGGLTIKAARALRYSVAPVVRRRCRHMAVSRGLRKNKLFMGSRSLVLMTDRSELDHYCLNKTLAAGAEFVIAKELERVTEADDFVEIATERGICRSRYLLGADGANSAVRRLNGGFPAFRRGFAIEAQLPVQGGMGYHMTFDFGVVASGYGWVFPKDDHINIGLYTYDDTIKLKAGDLYRYARARTGTINLRNMAAHFIGLGGWEYGGGSRRVFLVGDAAGLADPLLGEGLHNAIKSGQAAARAIIREMATGDAAACYHRYIAPIKQDALAGYKAAHWFYRFPAIGYAVLTFPAVRDRLMTGYAMGLTFNEIKGKKVSAAR